MKNGVKIAKGNDNLYYIKLGSVPLRGRYKTYIDALKAYKNMG